MHAYRTFIEERPLYGLSLKEAISNQPTPKHWRIDLRHRRVAWLASLQLGQERERVHSP